MTLGERITYYRNAAGLTQKALAEKMEIGTTRLNYWEKDKREPDVKMINRLARALKISPIALITEEDEQKTPPTPAEPEWEERLTNSNLDVVLETLGIVDVGQDLSEADAKFLADLLNLVRTWLQEKGKHH